MRTAAEKGTPIPLADVPNMIGKRVHAAWAKWGCNWVLKSVDGDMAILETPTTGKVLKTKVSDLVYTKKYAHRARQAVTP